MNRILRTADTIGSREASSAEGLGRLLDQTEPRTAAAAVAAE